MPLTFIIPEKVIEVFTPFTLPTKNVEFSQLPMKQHRMTRSRLQLMTETGSSLSGNGRSRGLTDVIPSFRPCVARNVIFIKTRVHFFAARYWSIRQTEIKTKMYIQGKSFCLPKCHTYITITNLTLSSIKFG